MIDSLLGISRDSHNRKTKQNSQCPDDAAGKLASLILTEEPSEAKVSNLGDHVCI
jgi:hypothetical protein